MRPQGETGPTSVPGEPGPSEDLHVAVDECKGIIMSTAVTLDRDLIMMGRVTGTLHQCDVPQTPQMMCGFDANGCSFRTGRPTANSSSLGLW